MAAIFTLIFVICNSLLYPLFDRTDEDRLWKASVSIDRSKLFTCETQNPLVRNMKGYFPKVRGFNDLLVEIQNFPAYHNHTEYKNGLYVNKYSNIFSLLYADFVLQLFSGNVPGWKINPNLTMDETQQRKSIHALVCAGGYSRQVKDVDITKLTVNKDTRLNEHFSIYTEAYTAGQTKNLIADSLTKKVMNSYMGEIKSIEDYQSYMLVVSMLRNINGYWLRQDISVAWEHGSKFFTKKQIEEINKLAENAYNDDKKDQYRLSDSTANEVLKKLLDVSNLGINKQEKLFEAYDKIKPYINQESAKKLHIMDSLSTCILTQVQFDGFFDLLFQIMDPNQTKIDPERFWDTLATFNEAAGKGQDHFIGMLQGMRSVILGGRKLIWEEFHQLARAFFRVKTKDQSSMAAIFQIMDDDKVKALDVSHDLVSLVKRKIAVFPYKAKIFEEISEAMANNNLIYTEAINKLKKSPEFNKIESSIQKHKSIGFM